MIYNFKDLIKCPSCRQDLEVFIQNQGIVEDEILNILGLYTLYCEKKREQRSHIPFVVSPNTQPLRIDNTQVQC